MEYEADGIFWLPDCDERVRGRLTFDQTDGGALRLEGLLVGEDGDTTAEVPVIVGKALDGTALCLLDTFPTQINFGFPQMPVYPRRYHVNRLLVGVSDPEQPFEIMRISIDGLLGFVAASNLSVTGGAGSDEEISIAWEPAESSPSALIDGDEIELVAEHRFRADEDHFSLRHLAEIEFRGEGRPASAWDGTAGRVEGFVSFLLGHPAWIDHLYFPAQGGAAPGRRDLPPSRASRRRLETCLDHAARRCRALRAGAAGLVCLLGQRSGDLPDPRWYLRVGGRLLHQDQLLYLARLVELYHRGAGRFEQRLIPKPEDRARKKAILAAAPTEHREWLKGALARANEKTLRDRITELVASFGEAVAPALGGDLDTFATSATDNRNYFTHYSTHYMEEGRVLEGMDLFYLVRRLLIVVRAAILREMGFDQQEIGSLLTRDPWYCELTEL
jgi:ApeA N-terminal domain 1